MNFLAHIYLSGNNHKLQLGNFFGDFVKGRAYKEYPEPFRSGIMMHRKIDTFTDNHPIFCETVDILRPTFRRYSGIMADLYFDYCLASDFDKYSPHKSLDSLAREFYVASIINYKTLPDNVKSFIFHFISTNRLKKYSTLEGLEDSLRIMSKKKSSAINPELSIDFLHNNESIIREKFDDFMPEVIHFAEKYIEKNVRDRGWNNIE